MSHVSSAEKREGTPKLGEEEHCGKSECPYPVFEYGFGLAGGGFGPYLYCTICNKVVAKSVLPDDEA